MILLLAALLSSAEVDPASLFLQANAAYEAGRYDEAVRGYESLLEASGDSGHVWYNLGNAYLRRGALGEAIAAYRRAGSLLPRDEDIRANLTFARQSARDAVKPPEPSPTLATLFFWHFRASPRELLVLLVAANAVLWGALALYLGRRDSEALRWTAVGATLVTLCLGSSLALRVVAPERLAVVRSAEAAVRAGIGEEAVVRFELHAGTETEWVEERDGWIRIALSDGKQGWVSGADVVRLQL